MIFTKTINVYLVAFLSLSFLFLPLTSLRAATISNGMDAAYVLGEPDFESVTFAGGAGDLIAPFDTSYDSVNKRLFVLDAIPFFGANRILVYDLSSGVTNGMDASYVLGQSDFISTASGTTAGLFGGMVYNIEYDSDNERLFVSDTANHRVLVYDLSGGITNGMDASYVLGQVDFTSGSEIFPVSTSTIGYPSALAYDNNNEYLYVGNLGYASVQVFDLSGGISNNMNASYILGQEAFGDTGANLDIDGMQSPQFLEYDEANERLFLTSDFQARTLVYDMSGGVQTGMDASHVIGQEDFTSNVMNLDQDGMGAPQGVVYDEVNNRLFISDGAANRVAVYDLSGIENGMDASYVLGQVDFNSAGTGTTASLFNGPGGMEYDAANNYLFVSDLQNSRLLVFDLSTTPTPSSNSSTGWNYTQPPLCTAQFTPNTITKGESTTLSWNTTWPTERENNYYTKVPGEGLYSQNVQSLTLQPQHTTEYTIAVFNLWGANFCNTTITVLDEEGNEVTSPNNTQLTAGVSNSPLVKAISNFFRSIFVK